MFSLSLGLPHGLVPYPLMASHTVFIQLITPTAPPHPVSVPLNPGQVTVSLSIIKFANRFLEFIVNAKIITPINEFFFLFSVITL